MEVNLERMEFARGGSTITQQLAKNLYLRRRRTRSGSCASLLRATARSGAFQAAHSRTVFELINGETDLRGGGGRAHLLSQPAGTFPHRNRPVAAAISNRADDRPVPRTVAAPAADGDGRMGAVTPPPVVAVPHPAPPGAAPFTSRCRTSGGPPEPLRRCQASPRPPKGRATGPGRVVKTHNCKHLCY